MMYTEETHFCEDIIAQKTSKNQAKRTITNTRLADNNLPVIDRTTTIRISEQAWTDTFKFHKTKDVAMVNILLKMVPKGVQRDLLITVLSTGNKKNIVFDTTKKGKSFTTWYAEENNVSMRSVQEAVRKLIDMEFVIKLNSRQYMLNPYFILHHDNNVGRVAELQHYWDTLVASLATDTPIKEEITWIKREKDTDSFETREDVLATIETIKASEAVFKEEKELIKAKKARTKETIANDISAIDSNSSGFIELFTRFMITNETKYKELAPANYLTNNALLAHLRRYILKAQRENYSAVIDLPTLDLTSSYKAVKHIIKLHNEIMEISYLKNEQLSSN